VLRQLELPGNTPLPPPWPALEKVGFSVQLASPIAKGLLLRDEL
jgi:hypothetical protein